MSVRPLFPMLALLACSVPAMAQDAGGVRLGAGVGTGPVGLARPLPFVRPPFQTAQSVQNGLGPADHQAQNQSMITALRGDPGFLSGFQFGTPQAASRQPAPTLALPDDGGYWYRRHHNGNGQGPVIINNQGPLAVTVGNGNVIQQSTANGSGPIAQQQVATVPGAASAGGAVNLATGSGNIVQRVP